MKAFTLSDLPAAFVARNAHLLGQAPAAPRAKVEAPKDRLRQDGAGMNKTEAAFFEHLRETRAGAYIHREPSLPIANGCRYKVDFLVATITGAALCVEAYEVKGFMREDAAVKLKVAASVYPWISFFLVTRGKGGTWSIQRIFS